MWNQGNFSRGHLHKILHHHKMCPNGEIKPLQRKVKFQAAYKRKYNRTT